MQHVSWLEWMHVLSIEMVDVNREGQVCSCRWTRGDEAPMWRIGPRDRGAGVDHGWLTLGDIYKQV